MDPRRLAALRREYELHGLAEEDLAPDPFTQFTRWLADVARAGLTEPNAMVLATADAAGRPSCRTVLLKGFDDRGFVFYTNRTSRKGRELDANPWASLDFPWYDLERQVVVVGHVDRVHPDEDAAYFRSRPHGAQVGAWASRQSQVVASRAVVEQRYAALLARWPEGGAEVPVPDFWGGYRVVPETVEFWQGRPRRLHDRLRYRRDVAAGTGWAVERLSP